ncbi:MAG: proline--tRNA ligase [Methanomicrobiales archaeon]|jgi:prolyl-tRNA synthetase|nr:proline--tRNA ligase [Methanomicrobiales archaeon]
MSANRENDNNTQSIELLPKKSDFSEWYNEILWRAEIMDVRYPIKGMYVWHPYGFGVRKRVYSILRSLLDVDHDETLFPLLIPEHEFMKEAEHIKGFENEVYWITHGGTTPLDVRLALRPTSETSIYPMYALWIRSHADLPLKLYQVVNTFRYETKHTRPLIRVREITSFKEAHTVHGTWDDAAEQVEAAVRLYQEFYDALCVPVLISKRPDWDKFPGADYTIAFDCVMPDGRTLQVGTVHHLGDSFSRTFDLTYEDINGEQVLCHQTCYGISERCIAALISTHGDDTGLCLPPQTAPVQIVIVPIIMKKREAEVQEAAQVLCDELQAAGFRVKVDARDLRPGAKYYHWELRGVPLRIEIGPRDIDNGVVMTVTRGGTKEAIQRENIAVHIQEKLASVTTEIQSVARERVQGQIHMVSTRGELLDAAKGGVGVLHWCGSKECCEKIEAESEAVLLGGELRGKLVNVDQSNCIICGEPGTASLLGRSY